MSKFTRTFDPSDVIYILSKGDKRIHVAFLIGKSSCVTSCSLSLDKNLLTKLTSNYIFVNKNDLCKLCVSSEHMDSVNYMYKHKYITDKDFKCIVLESSVYDYRKYKSSYLKNLQSIVNRKNIKIVY